MTTTNWFVAGLAFTVACWSLMGSRPPAPEPKAALAAAANATGVNQETLDAVLYQMAKVQGALSGSHQEGKKSIAALEAELADIKGQFAALRNAILELHGKMTPPATPEPAPVAGGTDSPPPAGPGTGTKPPTRGDDPVPTPTKPSDGPDVIACPPIPVFTPAPTPKNPPKAAETPKGNEDAAAGALIAAALAGIGVPPPFNFLIAGALSALFGDLGLTVEDGNAVAAVIDSVKAGGELNLALLNATAKKFGVDARRLRDVMTHLNENEDFRARLTLPFCKAIEAGIKAMPNDSSGTGEPGSTTPEPAKPQVEPR